jgi:DNA-binding NtrC family response regulator
MANSILIIEDEPFQRELLSQFLQKKGYQAISAGSGEEALAQMEASHHLAISLILLDLNLPKMQGLELLTLVRERNSHIPVIILTGEQDVKQAVHAIKLGATDFINKPPNLEHLAITIANALHTASLKDELLRLQRKDSATLLFTDIIGHDGGLAESISIARKAAQSLIPVSISGETGVGKELFARAIHGESERVGKPFVAVNCGAIPENLIESILFGHEKGAFTGATNKTYGKFREANGGTLFLDEVGELPLEAQVKLLRVLQQKEVEPVGSAATVSVDVRVISATNRHLRDCVEDGSFREDLYYRLHVLPLNISPLRQRKEDIPSLVKHFVARFNVKAKDLSPAAYQRLAQYHWPGNVRELQNVLHRSLVLSNHGFVEESEIAYIFEHPSTTTAPSGNSHHPLHLSLLEDNGALKTMEQVEAAAMNAVLQHHNQNITQAAKALGIAKSTFYKKMHKYGMQST